jgi:hypothetical protein
MKRPKRKKKKKPAPNDEIGIAVVAAMKALNRLDKMLKGNSKKLFK